MRQKRPIKRNRSLPNSPKCRKGGRFRARLPASSLRRLCAAPLAGPHPSDSSRRTGSNPPCGVLSPAAPDTPFLRTPAFRPRPCGPVSIPASRRGPSEPQAFRPGIRHLTFRPTLQSGPCGPFLGRSLAASGTWRLHCGLPPLAGPSAQRPCFRSYAAPPCSSVVRWALRPVGPGGGQRFSGSSQRPEQQRRSPFLM